jgi:hypothetical protein
LTLPAAFVTINRLHPSAMTPADAPRPPRGLLAAFFLLLVNSAYLAAFASPTLFYYGNVAGHAFLGVVLLILGTPWLVRRLARTSALGGLTAALLIAGGVPGAGCSSRTSS